MTTTDALRALHRAGVPVARECSCPGSMYSCEPCIDAYCSSEYSLDHATDCERCIEAIIPLSLPEAAWKIIEWAQERATHVSWEGDPAFEAIQELLGDLELTPEAVIAAAAGVLGDSGKEAKE